MINESSSIKDLELQAKNTKVMMDRLNSAYLGMTTDELIKLAIEREKIKGKDDSDIDSGRDRRTNEDGWHQDISGDVKGRA